MKRRCRAPSDPQYHLYGGRGITFSPEWDDFANFIRDMGRRPPKMTIERIDNSRGYEPGNCRWATMAEQNRNRRNTVWVELHGERMTLFDAQKLLGMPGLHKRMRNHNETPQEAVNFYAAAGVRPNPPPAPVGARFGGWEVIGLAEYTPGRGAVWQCRCECGTEKAVRPDGLKSGKTVSCGCRKPSSISRSLIGNQHARKAA